LLKTKSMPVAREKGGRRRTASSSSDCGVLQSPPRSQFFAVDFESNDIEGDLVSQASGDSTLQCCSPKCSVVSELDPGSPDSEVVKMICSNEKCPYSPFMHTICFSSFEEQLLSFLRGMSRARNWSEKQRKQNLWTKKGYDLIYKVSTCRCSKGTLRKDLSYNGTSALSGSGAGGSVVSEGTEKSKRRRKKSASGEKATAPIRAGNGAPRVRSRTFGRVNSDSVSSENGLVASSAPPALSGISSSYMQPFVHRTDYTVFEKLVPRHLVNSYHIKMEDDGYGAGDDTRSFVLSSLAFHRTSYINCILCSSKLVVYDQFPLVDGTFFLSPLKLNGLVYEVESKGENAYLAAVCLRCMVGANKVVCSYCFKSWNGTISSLLSPAAPQVSSATTASKLSWTSSISPSVSPSSRPSINVAAVTPVTSTLSSPSAGSKSMAIIPNKVHQVHSFFFFFSATRLLCYETDTNYFSMKW